MKRPSDDGLCWETDKGIVSEPRRAGRTVPGAPGRGQLDATARWGQRALPSSSSSGFDCASHSGTLLPPAIFCLLFACLAVPARANPVGATVVKGTATSNSSGPQLTIQTSDRAFINWQTFNIAVGETTTFVQPSPSSLVWNQINDANPSQILGNLNANGYVVLQNQSGFYIGGQAVITAHGLLMTTAPIPMPDLANGSAWQFSAPPPTASIVNYGQIALDKGGSVFLIAHDIQNNGTISAPGGKIGLYAGKDVLVSERPDGRGLSARVTLPDGSINNSGQITADGGIIAMHAQVVNQGGLVQANSAREVNGVIELVARDSLNLGPNSVISAKGDSSGTSPGGFVILKSDHTLADTPTSAITVSGGTAGGADGIVEIFGQGATASTIQSSIDGTSAAQFSSGNHMLLNANDLSLSIGPTTAAAPNPNFSLGDLSGYSKVALFANGNITLKSTWTLPASQDPLALVELEAGSSMLFNNNAGIKGVLTDSTGTIQAKSFWNVSLGAGTKLGGSAPNPSDSTLINGLQRLDGIYLDGNSSIQTLNGDISLWAANEIIVNPGDPYPESTGAVGNNGIRTLRGGNIEVTAEYGRVNSGGNVNGYTFGQNAPPYYKVSNNLGGISTAAGGDVRITAGGDVTSFLPVQNKYNDAQQDAGSGAFGLQPGNVTIVAGGNISGHYVLGNGIGTITAGGNIGQPTQSGSFALSLIDGNWSIYAPDGSIYLQDARNPSGIFNDKGGGVGAYVGYHLFDYSPSSSLLLNAGNLVEITGAGAPHTPPSAGVAIPFLFPPTLEVVAGAGGFVLNTDVILFPSSSGNLRITSAGNFQSSPDNTFTLSMSDSASKQWDPSPPASTFGSFLPTDRAPSTLEIGNPDPVQISVSGNMNNIRLYTTKATHITVGGDMYNSGLLGQNLNASDVTSINVAGKIYYPPIYTFTTLAQAIVGADPLNPSAWDSIFALLVDPVLTAQFQVPANATVKEMIADAALLKVFQSAVPNPGFIYDPATLQLGFQYQMSDIAHSHLNGSKGPLEIISLDQFGHPEIRLGQANLGQDPTKYYFATTPVSFVPFGKVNDLYNSSLQSAKDVNHLSPGFQIGGPGRLEITAASMNLGSSSGIISWGIGNGSTAAGGINYASLGSVTESGASVEVNVAGDLSMLTSTIASIYGGDVMVNTAGKLDLSLGAFSFLPPNAGAICYGIFTSGHSDVEVTAGKDINVGSARIATFNGGNVFVESLDGKVNAGNGANSTLTVPILYRDPASGQSAFGTIVNPKPFGSGILAISPTEVWQTPGGNLLPGNITVETPRGDIVSTLGGIQQFALNGSIAGGPTITLTAGTPPSAGSAGYAGNIDLGAGGVIGGSINIAAQGNVRGLIVSRQNSTVNAAQSFSGTVLAAGTANISATAGTISGTVVGIGGVNASGSGGVTASLLGQNVSVGGAAAQSTLGTTAGATATSQAAAQQATTEANQQVASNKTPEDDDQKKAKKPTLTRRVGRVTVVLPPKS